MSKLPPLSKGKMGRKFTANKSGAKVNFEAPKGGRRRGKS
jgi:hypothetical protein